MSDPIGMGKSSFLDKQMAKTKVELEVMKEKGKISELKEHLSGIDQKMKALTKLIDTSSDSFSRGEIKKEIKLLKEEIKTIKKAVKQEGKLTSSKEFRNKFSFLKKVNSGEVPLLRLNRLKANLISADHRINNILSKHLTVQTSSSSKKTSQTGLKLIGQYKDVSFYLKHHKVADLIKQELGLAQRNITNTKDMLSYMEGIKNKKEAIDNAIKDFSNLKQGNAFFSTTLTNVISALKNKNESIKQEIEACKQWIISNKKEVALDGNVKGEIQKEFSFAYGEMMKVEKQFNSDMRAAKEFLTEFSKYMSPQQQQLFSKYIGFLTEIIQASDKILSKINNPNFFETIESFKITGGEAQIKESITSLVAKDDVQSRMNQINGLISAFSGEGVVRLTEGAGNWMNNFGEIQKSVTLMSEVIEKHKNEDNFLVNLRGNEIIKKALNVDNSEAVTNNILNDLFAKPNQIVLKYPLFFNQFVKNSTEEFKKPLERLQMNIEAGALLMNMSKAFKQSEGLYK